MRILRPIAAALCGFAFTLFLLMLVCLRYSRDLDAAILADLATLLPGVCIAFLAVRLTDRAWPGQFDTAFSFRQMSLTSLSEAGLKVTPALALLFRRVASLIKHVSLGVPRWDAISCLLTDEEIGECIGPWNTSPVCQGYLG
jgi:hypothetical protein